MITAIENLKLELDIPSSIREVLSVDEQTFFEHLDLMSEQAFDDQCTGANPRYPLIRDLKALYLEAYQNSSQATTLATEIALEAAAHNQALLGKNINFTSIENS